MYLLYTHNDLDGLGCGIVARCAFGHQVEIRYNSVGGLNVQVERFLERSRKNKVLYITDLSVNEENEKGLDEFSKAGGKVKLIDHHKTALHYNKYPWGMVQVEYENGKLASATSLFYEYLVQNGLLKPTKGLDEFVELVRQYDTWEWERHGELRAKRLHDLFNILSIDEFEDKMVERLKQGERFMFDEFEEKILDIEEEKIDRYVRRKKREIIQTRIHDYYVGIVHAESYHSELGNELGKENPHLDYVAIMNLGGKRISFRTIHDHVDVSEIAALYGGGGHAKASGCSMTEEAYRLYVAKTFPLEPMRMDAFRNTFNLKKSVYGSLYENRKDQKVFIFPSGAGWEIDVDGNELNEHYSTFEEAERFVKRNYSAWLVRDEVYIAYLMEHRVERSAKQH
ncbi:MULTISPECIES: oligoribonuclease [unclassified Paenibacillus]|uniref:DHH family phosphoesterase n=1 Tax=unclassified Paenibacillus TaxID=185978 RepID=UPI001AE5D33C|nr:MULTISPECIES: oligoribonuclease [unclassified Paenibacillus]MBP1155607.1 oligoribonuclease NrnB/cAMP/cGMP phosphodiesterase (DHH superfamily) [Paenibacillus sp. PvP091]MBP1169007.1 oligoribonuclease NrnB/cAMP/cGMP phosphodiesterase (DHH superfamily) [Paenibacillus sp. PvR098]MBP2440035.1 oligoribonuclease NrnB/cAMP/cGMP phosphodiesterase (DHH superfamily) [Paenibacillus sp. PvP052]